MPVPMPLRALSNSNSPLYIHHSSTSFHCTKQNKREMTSRNTSSTARVQLWKSPIPYLFGGIAVMIGLMAVALVILACSNRKHSPNDAEEMPVINTLAEAEADAEPKIVVIMAGENNPTYIATPLTSST